MLSRTHYIEKIMKEFQIHPVCALLGPRQCGKTTLASQYLQTLKGQQVRIFDLEDPLHIAQLESPRLLLENLEGTIVFDEIQRRPDLFPYLRTLVDRYPNRRYLVLGSASPALLQQSSETLAGRIGYIEVT